MLQTLAHALKVELLVVARVTIVHVDVVISHVHIKAFVSILVRLHMASIKIPLLVASTMAVVHGDVVVVTATIMVVSTLVGEVGLELPAAQVELLTVRVVAVVEINVTVLVVHALGSELRFDLTGISWTEWMCVEELLIIAAVACMHVDVPVVPVHIQAFIRGVSCFKIFAIEIPLLIGSTMTSMHIDVIVVVVHIQAFVVVIGLHSLIVHIPFLVGARVAIMHVHVVVTVMVIQTFVRVP